jgi:uncharacterized membrane protein
MKLLTKILASTILLVPLIAGAQVERSYHYAAIDATYTVNQDTTVDVEERQTYEFVGEYYQGWRNIPRKGVDEITNVTVIDAATGQPLEYSTKRLDKTKPESWGKYTTYSDDGETIIEWYYDAKDTTRTWILKYKLLGSIAFYKDHDELYWNIFSDFDVPVNKVSAKIILPGAITATSSSLYTTNSHDYTFTSDAQSYTATVAAIEPHEAVTFAVGWQKGLVDESAYRSWFYKRVSPLVAGVMILLASIVFSILYWRRQEYVYRGKGTVIPQYEPPKHLPPAMAEVAARGSVSSKAWSATVVDLAVRGYVVIDEVESDGIFGWFKSKDYKVKRTAKSTEDLREYEQEFVSALFDDSDTFSTKELSKSPTKQHKLVLKISKITDRLYKDTEVETDAYTVDPKSLLLRKKAGWAVFFAPFVAVASFLITDSVFWFLGTLLCTFAAALVVYVVKIRPQLNRTGHILREEWAGFKLFLSVTGRDRMQNLTPDMFEKYLPYAMMFGVEKKWAEAFKDISLPPPNWYHSNSAAFVAMHSGGGAGSFSPTSFASGFSASFASSFASSGGGGASGGGGGAGGGGGGGGGGAS